MVAESIQQDRGSRSLGHGSGGVAAIACVLPLIWATMRPRQGRSFAGASPIVLVMALSSSAGVTAGPRVTAPAKSVARFSVAPRPLIACLVDCLRVQAVGTSQIGSLFGP